MKEGLFINILSLVLKKPKGGITSRADRITEWQNGSSGRAPDSKRKASIRPQDETPVLKKKKRKEKAKGG
jgi:hypothetical protein